MRTLLTTLAFAALSLATAARPASAQDATARAAASAKQPADTGGRRSSRSGVYTAAQAERGAEVYAGFCRSCHAAASHSGPVFAGTWKGRTVADLYGYVSEQMPKNDPGGLDAAQYADVVAYILRVNAMPAGRSELRPDPAALAAIRIDVVAPAVKAVPKRGPPVRKNPRSAATTHRINS